MKSSGSNILLLVRFVPWGSEYVPGTPLLPNPVIGSKTGEPLMLKNNVSGSENERRRIGQHTRRPNPHPAPRPNI